MKTVRVILQGGLGNQMFTYFAAADYADQNNLQLILDTSELPFGISSRVMELDKLTVPFPYRVLTARFLFRKNLKGLYIRLRRVFLRYFPMLIHSSKVVGYDESLDFGKRFYYIRGYFQTWKYLQSIKGRGIEIDVVPVNPTVGYKECLDLMEVLDPICIHVRRGDYQRLREEFGCLAEKFFENSLAEIDSTNRPIWLFSDEPELVKTEFTKIKFDLVPATFYNLDGPESLIAMSKSSTLIMSNSSFSWWAASLGNQNKEIISPTPWFRNLDEPTELCFPHWKRVPAEWD